jgi:DNA ligase-1
MAPDWFLNTLPATLLDGELYAGRGKFQLCRSICGGDTPDPRFDQIRYAVYSAPSVEQVFQTGEVKNANMLCWIDYLKCIEFFKDQLEVFEGDFLFSPARCFKEELTFLSQVFESQNKYCFPLKQERLPLDLGPAHVQVCRVLDEVVKLGGEGVVLRDPQAAWLPKRHAGILKYKPFHDCEVRITGFTSGRQTDKGSKHLGKIGALITEYRGKRLEVSGLTDEEREFLNSDMALTATERPGADMPKFFQGKHFKVGQTITILYRELSDNQIPKEARFLRKRETE